METRSFIIVGVGGQGTVLASRGLGQLFLNAGYDVKVSEVHGMSQRGGSVVTYVRYGDKVYSPIIDKGEADYIVSFELLETARYLPYLKKGGKIVSNTQTIEPMPVITGAMERPENIEAKIKALGIDADFFDALSVAREAGSAKAVNIALLGRLSNYLDFSEEECFRAIEGFVPPAFLELNKKAFILGRNS